MLLTIIIFLLSLVPSILIYIWMRNRHRDDGLYKKQCRSAFIRGLITVIPIVALSALLYLLSIVLKATAFQNMHPLIYQAIYKFIVLALAEEAVKYVMFRLLLRKKEYAYTWADVTSFMVIIGTAFGMMEDITYAVGANAITMLVRGFTMGHIGYGFIMGWFHGKRLYTGKKIYGIIAFIFPWLLHGLYDFSLSTEFIEINDNMMFVAVAMAIAELVTLALAIRFFITSRKKERCNEQLIKLLDAVNNS